MKDIELVLNFNGSKHVLDISETLPQQGKKRSSPEVFAACAERQPGDDKILNAVVKAKSHDVFVCMLSLGADWKLRVDFNFKIKNCGIE